MSAHSTCARVRAFSMGSIIQRVAIAALLLSAANAGAQTMEVISGQGRFRDVPGTTVGFQPGAIAAAPDGYLYVSDINGKLMRLNTETDLVTALPATLGGLNHNLGYTYGMAVDFSGRPHVYSQGALHRIGPDGSLTNTGAAWSGPMAFAPDGNLYIAPGDNRVYRRDPSGNVEPFAGGEEAGFGGDGGPAAAALLSNPEGIAVAANGDIYISDSGNNRIRVISASAGTISTFAGDGGSGPTTDGQHGLSTSLYSPRGLTLDGAGNLIVSAGNRILRIDAVTRIVTIVAGNGTGTVGDGGPAISATISWARYVAVDASGNIYFSDGNGAQYIRKITASTGIVTRVLGYEHSIYCGVENGPAHEACLTQPVGLATNALGQLFIADVSIQRIRRIVDGSSGRTISTYRQMAEAPIGVEFDAAGNLYTASYGNYQVNRIDASTGDITVVAGGRGYGFGGDGGPATSAALAAPTDIAFDAAGNLYIADAGNGRVRRVEAGTGIISTYAMVYGINAIEFDPAGNLVAAGNCQLRRIDAVTRAVTLIAGTGTCWSSDIPGGTPATTTHIGRTNAFAFDPAGNIYVAWYEQIYKIDASTGIINRVPVPGGVLTTVEGLRLRYPTRMEADPLGNLYISQNAFPNIYLFKVSGLTGDPTPPVVTANVSGTAGDNGWYRSNVSVSWSVSDAESAISSNNGCASTSITEDTTGVTLTCSATSAGGTTTRSVTIRKDTLEPYVTFGAATTAPNAAGWYRTDVSFPWTVSDATSGFSHATSPGPITVTGEGDYVTANLWVTDMAGNTRLFQTPPVAIDRTAPTVSLLYPEAGRNYGAFSTTNAQYTCSDTFSTHVSCVGTVPHGSPIPTNTSGAKTFTVTATDAAGNATTVSRSYSVAAMQFEAWLELRRSPITNDITAGQLVPIRWRLRDGVGGLVRNPAAFQSLNESMLTCQGAVVPFSGSASGGPGLSVNASTGVFTYNWQTAAGSTGCRRVLVNFADGSSRELWFSF